MFQIYAGKQYNLGDFLSHKLTEAISFYGAALLATAISVLIILYSVRRQQVSKPPTHLGGKRRRTMTSIPRPLPEPGKVKVSKLLIHPIKSCRGVSVESVKYTPEGVQNDRLWCIIDAEKLNVITAREVPKMVLITPQIQEEGIMKISFPEDSGCEPFSVPLNPSAEELQNWTCLPNIILWPTSDPVDGYVCESLTPGLSESPSKILSEYFGRSVHLVFKGPRPRPIDPTTLFPELKATAKFQDMYPMLILSEESTVEIEEELREHVGTQGIEDQWKTGNVIIERFRPNIVIKGGGSFAEDDWEEIRIGAEGAPRITLVSKCTRCLLPNVSPETGERDKAVPYKVLMKFRTGLDPDHKMKPCVGCNAVPDGEGVVNVGDWVYVKK